jgi:hypothetical protein
MRVAGRAGVWVGGEANGCVGECVGGAIKKAVDRGLMATTATAGVSPK